MNEQICTKCQIPKSISNFPIGRKCCCECLRKYKNHWNLISGRRKNVDGSKLKHVPKYNLIGKRFGNLSVLEFSGIKDNPSQPGARASFFVCKCDCGNTKEVAGVYLKNGNTKSCGCLIHNKIRNLHQNWMGYKGLSGSSWDRIEKNGKNNRRIKRRNLEFTITKEYVWGLYEKQNGKCSLSGMDIVLDVGSKLKQQTASLDRIDSSKGYVEGNVQWVHKDVNNMKQDFDESYFVGICNHISKYRCS